MGLIFARFSPSIFIPKDLETLIHSYLFETEESLLMLLDSHTVKEEEKIAFGFYCLGLLVDETAEKSDEKVRKWKRIKIKKSCLEKDVRDIFITYGWTPEIEQWVCFTHFMYNRKHKHGRKTRQTRTAAMSLQGLVQCNQYLRRQLGVKKIGNLLIIS